VSGVVPFPTAARSDEIIESAMPTAGHKAKVGDVCIFCTDADDDIWTVQLVGLVDDRGACLAIRTSTDEIV